MSFQEIAEENGKKPSFIISTRFLLAILVFLGYCTQYAQKIDMSVSIVCMINNTALKLKHVDSLSEYAENLSVANNNDCAFKSSSHHSHDGEFEWSRSIQGFILAAYFYGYFITEIPGGFLSWKFGGKRVYLISMFLGSIGTLLTPICAQYHYGFLIAIRFITGLVHGVMWPSVASIWAHWAVPTERSRLLSIGNAGSQIGNVIALPLSSYLCVNGFAGGWPSIFYVFGIAGIVWCVLWFFLVADTPNDHKFISNAEKVYINLKTENSNHSDEHHIPWKDIFTSKPAYALFVAHFCSNCGVYLFLTNMPTYMKEVLKFDIKSNGLLSALPYLSFWFMIILSGIIGDKLIQSGKVSRTKVRKIFNGLGFIVPALSIIALSFVRCNNPYLGVVFLIIGLSFNGCAYGAGFLVNCNDLAGQYSGVLFGISNTSGSWPGIIAPYLVGFMTKNQKPGEWQMVFIIIAVLYAIGAVFFTIFGSAELQSWANDKTKNSEIKNEEFHPLKSL